MTSRKDAFLGVLRESHHAPQINTEVLVADFKRIRRQGSYEGINEQ
jgi:hypothetical protein